MLIRVMKSLGLQFVFQRSLRSLTAQLLHFETFA